MKETHVLIPCRLNNGKLEKFYFFLDEDNLPVPNLCEQGNGSAACRACCDDALKILLARKTSIINDPLAP